MFPRRCKRRYDACGVELKTYDSIEEENDDLQDSEDSNDDRCDPLDEYEENEDSMYKNYSRRKSICNSQNSRRSNSVSDISGNGEKSSIAQFQRRCCQGCHEPTMESVVNGNTCSGYEPKPLKMPNVEQIKKFGGVVCPKCSQLFTRIGFIKESDLRDDSIKDNSPPSLDSKIFLSDDDHKTFQENIYSNDRFDSKHSLTNHSKEIDQLLYQKFVPKLNGETLFSSDLLVKATDDVLPYKPRQKDHSQSFSHVPLRPNGEVGPKLSNSMGDVRSRVRQSFQNSFSAISEKGNRAFNILRQQEKAAKQLSLTLSCLFLCWTPYFVQVILYSICPQTANEKFLAVSVYLGYFHSLCNPILFVIFNLKFQRAFKKAMCCFPRDDKRKPYIPKQPSAL
ncbi:Octopamine receptor beta-3R [Holothuria leucospilota]|uniref:Octopamine receptor beta-3R n=1 Tax=Holothuria leucospilota TaxID=206669 RepID=A0A9Q1CMG6_HOLLE|nr:Octopamine receptor beta-3R [Holothuria leucospilota]